MKTMLKLFKSKKGFTLVEMITATLILSILMSITMGMMMSSGRLFSDTASLRIDKEIGDSVYNRLESVIKYSTHLEIADANYTVINEKYDKILPDENCTEKSYQQGFYIGKDGMLKHDAKDYGKDGTENDIDEDTNDETKEYTESKKTKKYNDDVYPKDFYQGRTVKFTLKPLSLTDDDKENKKANKDDKNNKDGKDDKENENNDNNKSHRHLELTVTVYKDGKSEYVKTSTIRCVNLGLFDSNVIVDSSSMNKETKTKDKKTKNKDKNQYLNFSCDEELSISDASGYDLYEHAENLMAEYNRINTELKIALDDAIVKYADNESERKSVMQEASDTAKLAIKELLGFTPKDIPSGSSEPLKYFNGVQATEEEIFYSVLLNNYPVDNKVQFESYQTFHDKGDNFFKNSTFDEYGFSLVQLIKFNMLQDASYDTVEKKYQGSQIQDFIMYAVKWDDWFSTYRINFLTHRRTHKQLIDTTKSENSLGRVIDGQYSYQRALAVFHPSIRAWYYMPKRSNIFSNIHDDIWGKDHKPREYNLKGKDTGIVELDINSNTNLKVNYIDLGLGRWEKRIDWESGKEPIVWNSLPAYEFDVDN